MSDVPHLQPLPPELIRGVLESAPDATIIVNRSGTILFANSRTEKLFGYGDDLIGRNVDTLLPERYRDDHAGQRRRYMADPQPRPMGTGLELFARHRDGTEFPVEISLSPAHCEPEPLVVAAIRDMSAHTRIEGELRAARAEAEHANRAKSRILATASHDLRQPLQALALLNATLRLQVSGTDAQATIAEQSVAIDTMGRLVNALLDISKLESGAIRPAIESFALGPLFQQLRQEFEQLARTRGIALQVEPATETVLSDISLVAQVLRNLLSNALKYTHSGSVRLSCRRDADAVRIDVSDTGMGIPADQLAYIYDEFYQVGVRSNESRNGYGLGLSIVQRIVQLLQLRLDVSSTIGVGSTFSMVLPPGTPVVQATAHDDPAERPRASPEPLSHILLVEDDAAVRSATRLFLKSCGYRVSSAACVAEALARAAESPDVDVVVSDLHLADGESGLDAITAVRSTLGRNVSAIIVTGDTSQGMRGLALDAHIRMASKPIQADEMLSLLKELLRA